MANKGRYLLKALQEIPPPDLYNTLIRISDGNFTFDEKPLSQLSPEELALHLEHLMIQTTGVEQESRICKPYFQRNPRIFYNYINQFCSIIGDAKYRGSSNLKLSLEYGLLVQKSRLQNINSNFVKKTAVAVAVILVGVVVAGSMSAFSRTPAPFFEDFFPQIYASDSIVREENVIPEIFEIFENNVQEEENNLENSDLYLTGNGEPIEELDEEPVEDPIEEPYESTLQEAEPAAMVLNQHLTNLARRHGIRSVTFMWYGQITNPTANQFHLLHTLDLIEHTDDGFIKVGDYYAVALGSQFGQIGSKFVIRSEDGSEIRVIKAEAKADIHTINGFAHAEDHSIVEFLLNFDNEVIQEIIRNNPGAGRNAAINRHCRTKFSGCIRYIYRVADNGLIELVRARTWEHNHWPRI